MGLDIVSRFFFSGCLKFTAFKKKNLMETKHSRTLICFLHNKFLKTQKLPILHVQELLLKRCYSCLKQLELSVFIYFQYQATFLLHVCKDMICLYFQWQANQSEIENQGTKILDALTRGTHASDKGQGEALPSDDQVVQCFQGLSDTFDKDLGGFGTAPKFPQPGGPFL